MKFLRLLCLMAMVSMVLTSCDDQQDDERNAFVGFYAVSEESQGLEARDDYEVRIRKRSGSNDLVLLSNFYNIELDVEARVDGNMIYIPQQTRGFFVFEGEGFLTGSTIRLQYTVSRPGGQNPFEDRLNATLERIFQ